MALADEIAALAAYMNAPRDHFDADELALFDEDLIKARAAVEVAWLERLAAGMTNPCVEERHGANSERLTFDPVIGLTTTNIKDGW